MVLIEPFGERKGWFPGLFDSGSRLDAFEAVHMLLIGEDLGR